MTALLVDDHRLPRNDFFNNLLFYICEQVTVIDCGWKETIVTPEGRTKSSAEMVIEFAPEVAFFRSRNRKIDSEFKSEITLAGPEATISAVCGEFERIFKFAGRFFVFSGIVNGFETVTSAKFIVVETVEISPSARTPSGKLSFA